MMENLDNLLSQRRGDAELYLCKVHYRIALSPDAASAPYMHSYPPRLYVSAAGLAFEWR